MNQDDRAGLLDAKPEPSIVVTSADSLQSSQVGAHQRNSLSFDRSNPVERRFGHDSAHPQTYAQQYLTVAEPAQAYESNSLLRRLSTRLLSNTVASRYRSTKRSRGKQYATLEDAEMDLVPVDLSSLSGLGFELREGQVRSTEHLADQDTSYPSRNTQASKPDFNEFRKRRTLGEGMIIGAQLQRDTSVVDKSPSAMLRATTAVNLQRSKTVKGIGQDLADQRNMIVAVSEPVDLSSLEGTSIQHKASDNFDDIVANRRHTLIDDPQSYFFPADPDIPNWRPVSMRAPYILTLILVAIGLAGFQEYLCELSARKAEQTPPSGLLSFNKVADVSTLDFFVWKYLPTMITIIYAVAFSIMDFDIRRLESFYQLSQPQGSRASASLNVDHLTMFQYLLPFKAIKLKQWTVFASTIANIMAATIAPALQNPSVNFQMNSDAACTVQDGCPDGAKLFWVRISPVWSRLLSVAYLIIAVVTMFVFFKLRRKSGLLSDPKGIAGIASMATKSHILRDFKGLDTANRAEIHRRLAHRRYILYKSSIWQGEWNQVSEPPHDSQSRLHSPHPFMLRLVAGIPFIVVLVVCLAFVPLICFTAARAIPNAVPWLPILVATLLKLVWNTFEADVRLIEPFYQLSEGNAKPENSLTLDYQATVYGWMPFKALLNRHYLVAIVGFSSVFLDMLAVTVGSFSVDSQVFLRHAGRTESNQDETYVSFIASATLSIVILIFVIVTAILVYVYRRHAFLPREPSTIAAVFSFIYASKMLDDFIDTETLTNKAMETRLKALGKRYALGWFTGRDGQVHCAIDEEPIRSRYVHGKPYSDAVTGPSQDPFLYG